MITYRHLSQLKTNLVDLYENKVQINVHLSDKEYRFYVVLLDVYDKIDCKISSYTANIWTRTANGMTYKKYSSLQTLERAIINQIDKKIDTNGVISFSLSTHIDLM